MRVLPFLAAAVASLPGAAAAADLALAPFRSIELRGGGNHATVRHGPAQLVTLLEGDAGRVSVESGRLVVAPCAHPCRHPGRLRLAIVTPELDGLALSDGGSISAIGPFPRQAEVQASVSQGGTIDIRSLAADSVAASVRSGGRILTRPGAALTASISHGGVVVYWGEPRVRRAVEDGGAVEKGERGDAAKPLDRLDSPAGPIPPLPPIESRR